MFVEGLIEGIGLALGFDVEGRTGEVDEGQGVENFGVATEGLAQVGGRGVGLRVGAGGFVQCGDDEIHVRLFRGGGEDGGGVIFQRQLGRGVGGGGDFRGEVGGFFYIGEGGGVGGLHGRGVGECEEQGEHGGVEEWVEQFHGNEFWGTAWGKGRRDSQRRCFVAVFLKTMAKEFWAGELISGMPNCLPAGMTGWD